MFSSYLQAAWLNAAFKATAYTPPSTVYLALFTGAITRAFDAVDAAKEVSGGSYARTAVAFDDVVIGTDTATISNDVDILSVEATADWGTITHIGIMDAATGGHLLAGGALTASKLIETGDQFRIAAGNLDFGLGEETP